MPPLCLISTSVVTVENIKPHSLIFNLFTNIMSYFSATIVVVWISFINANFGNGNISVLELVTSSEPEKDWAGSMGVERPEVSVTSLRDRFDFRES